MSADLPDRVAHLDRLYDDWLALEGAVDAYVHRHHAPSDSEPAALEAARNHLKDGKFAFLEHLNALRELARGRVAPAALAAITVTPAALADGAPADAGPLQPFLADPAVVAVRVVAPDRAFVERADDADERVALGLADEDALMALFARLLAAGGATLLPDQPQVAAIAPGIRLVVAPPAVTDGRPWATLVKPFLAAATLPGLVERGLLPAPVAAFLGEAAASGLTILVVGPHQAGRTSLLTALARATPPERPGALIEPVHQVLVGERWPRAVVLTANPLAAGAAEPTLPALLARALAAVPAGRLVIDDLNRYDDWADALPALLGALATTHRGGLLSMAERDLDWALTRLGVVAAGDPRPPAPAAYVRQVVEAIDLVVEVGRPEWTVGGGRRAPTARRVCELIAVEPARVGWRELWNADDAGEAAAVAPLSAGRQARMGGRTN